MPLKVKWENFKDLTDGSDRFVHMIREGKEKSRITISTTQYLTVVEVDNKELEKIKTWLDSKGSVESEGFIPWDQAFRSP